MMTFTAKLKTDSQKIFATLTLPLDLRQKSRQRVVLDNGKTAALVLKRGTVLYHNDLLVSDETIIQVKAADERLSVIECTDPLLFARACYHLGNRHVPLQIEQGRLSYLHDHVLDNLLRELGLEVKQITAPFEPEPGAYGGQAGKVEKGHHHGH